MRLALRRVAGGVAVGLACATAAAVAAAQAKKAEPLDVKLGLWALTGTAQNSGPNFDTSKMSDQEKAMVAQMTQRMQAAGSMPQTTHQCVTKDKLTQALFQPEDVNRMKDTKCTRTLVAGTTASQDSTFECTGANAGSGAVHVDRVSDDSVTGSGTMKLKGQDMTVSFSFTGKWVGDDCRGIK